MFKTITLFLSDSAVILAAALMVGCGSTGGSSMVSNSAAPPTSGSVVAFGADAPICDVESFIATITSASLVPQRGGTAVTVISSTVPATVDFRPLGGLHQYSQHRERHTGNVQPITDDSSESADDCTRYDHEPADSSVGAQRITHHVHVYGDDQSGLDSVKFHHQRTHGGL